MRQVENLITENIDLWASAVKVKPTQGRGTSKKIELYGIKKLRELILELAIRGLLVPQKPNDEPASQLLKKIAAVKAKLIKEGKIKKQKPLPPINDDEKPFELPEGWEWVRLQDVSEYIQRGKGPTYSDSGKVRVVSQKCIQWSGFDLEASRYVDDESLDQYQEERFLKNNDLLWNSTGTGTAGRINLITGINVNTLVADSHVTIVRTLIENAGFICRYISSAGIQKRIEPGSENSLVSGTTNQVELNTSTVLSLPVPFPSLEEQHRIVAKVDELMELCDQLEQQTEASLGAHKTLVESLLAALTNSATHKGQANFEQAWQLVANNFDTLFTTEWSIDQLKQTILQLAVMGKLVPQNPNDEPASQLLKKIAAEKAKLIKEGKIKKQKTLPPISEDEKLFGLPKGWGWSQLGVVSEIAPRNNLEDGLEVGFVPMPMITTSYKGNHEQEIKQWGEIKKGYTHFANGDIGLAKITPCFENSKAAVFENLKNGFGAGTTELHIARPITGTLDPLYILLYLKSPMFLEKGKTKMTGSAGQKRVPNEYFSGNALPFAPLEEQHRIVAKVDELMTLCDQLKANLNNAQTTQMQLADAMAEQAIG